MASSFFHPSSVSYDFCGMLSRSSRDRFKFTWITFQEKHPADGLPPFLQAMKNRRDMKGRPAPELVLVYTKVDDEEKDAFDRPPWLMRYYAEMPDLKLDIILFLDLTMGPMITRAALARVARTQVVSHGHPVTSGIPPGDGTAGTGSMDYYISWAAAEVGDHELAQTHYTENLVLLPVRTMHQYYSNVVLRLEGKASSRPRLNQSHTTEEESDTHGDSKAGTMKVEELYVAETGKRFDHLMMVSL